MESYWIRSSICPCRTSGHTGTQAAGIGKSSNAFDGPDRASARRPKSLNLTTNKLRQMSPENIS